MERPLNHRYREPGTEQGSGRLTREQEAHAAGQISRGLEAAQKAGGSIDASTARLIAAALHAGRGSHLEQFASTGALNPTGSLEEIGGGGRVELHHIPWIAALWDFLEQITGPDPDRPEAQHEEPDPLIYVQAHDPDVGLRASGAWLNPHISATALAEQMRAVADLIEVDGASPAITATVGFHQLALPAEAPAREVAAYARGVARFGEPYALYAQHVGRAIGEDDFLVRHEGTYESMAEFIASRPADSLAHLRHVGGNTYRGRTASFDDFEQTLRGFYDCFEGREGLHVFHKQFGYPKAVA